MDMECGLDFMAVGALSGMMEGFDFAGGLAASLDTDLSAVNIPMESIGEGIAAVADVGEALETATDLLDAGKFMRRLCRQAKPGSLQPKGIARPAAFPGVVLTPPPATHQHVSRPQIVTTQVPFAPQPSLSPCPGLVNSPPAPPPLLPTSALTAVPPAAVPYSTPPQQVFVHHAPSPSVTVINQAPGVPYSSTMAVVNLVWAILGIACCLSPISISALVFAFLAMSTGAKNSPQANRYAKIALWLNVGNLVLVIAITVAIVVLVIRAADDDNYDYY